MLGAEVPEAYGGPGGTFAHDAVITFEANRAGIDGWGGPLHNAIVIPYIVHYGSEEQKQRWLPEAGLGRIDRRHRHDRACGGSDLQSVNTTATRDGNDYVINGAKTFITNGQTANLIIIVTKTDPAQGAKGISLFVVETEPRWKDSAAAASSTRSGSKPNDTSELFFDDVRVPPIAPARPRGGPGLHPAHAAAAAGAPAHRHLCDGADRASADRCTLDYVKERTAFGKRDHRFPEQPVRAGRMQDRGDDRAGCSSITASSAI